MMDYRQLAIDMLEHIQDERFLRRIYTSLKDYVKESEVTGNEGTVNKAY